MSGAFWLGTVVGWFLYYTNRYRTEGTQIADVGALIGAIAGAIVIGFVTQGAQGAASASLVSEYGVGLAVGFFGYFFVLVAIVLLNPSAYDFLWFLDGRRKRPSDVYEFPTNPQRPMAPPPFAAETPPPTTTSSAEAQKLRSEAITAVQDAIDELQTKMGNTVDDKEITRLETLQMQLFEKRDQLVAARLKEILDGPDTQKALLTLQSATDSLKSETGRLKSATEAVKAASQVVDKATRVLQFLAAFA